MTCYPVVDPKGVSTPNTPFIIAECFTKNSVEFLEKFLDDSDALEEFCHLFRTHPVDNTLAGYVSKVFTVLLSRSVDKIFSFLTERNIFPLLVANLHLDAVGDLAIELLKVKPDNQFEMHQRGFFQGIINALRAPKYTRVASRVLSALLKKNDFCDITADLLQPNNAYGLARTLTHPDQTVAAAALTLLKCILTSPTRPHLFNQATRESFLEAVCTQLKPLCEVLEEPSHSTRRTSFGKEVPVLGQHKVWVAELLNELLQFQVAALELTRLRLTKTMTDLFFMHEWASIFHNVYVEFVRKVLSSDCPSLVLSLVKDAQLISRLVEAGLKPEESSPLGSARRGHLVKLGILLHNCEDIGEELDTSEEWTTFNQDFLTPRIRIERRLIGLSLPSTDQSFEVDDSEELEEPQELDEPRKLQQLEEFHESQFTQVNYWKLSYCTTTLEELA